MWRKRNIIKIYEDSDFLKQTYLYLNDVFFGTTDYASTFRYDFTQFKMKNPFED